MKSARTWMRLVAGWWLCAAATVLGTGNGPEMLDFPVVSTTILPESPEADNLLRNAEDAIELEDWKAAVDSLQRIIEGDYGALISQDDRHYESARLHALRSIAELPPEGLEVYRTLYDAQAGALVERARRDHDREALREVMDRFFLSRFGDDAADLSAAWLIDDGQAGAALRLLNQIRDLYPDTDIPAEIIAARRSIAAAEAGMVPIALEALEQFRDLSRAGEEASALYGMLSKFVASKAETDDVDNESRLLVDDTPAWPSLLGPPRRAGRMSPVVPSLVDFAPWNYRLPMERLTSVARLNQTRETLRAYPIFYGTTDGRRLFVRSEQQVVALDLESMEEVWRSRRVVNSLSHAYTDQEFEFHIDARGGDGRLERIEDRDGQVFRTLIDELSGSLSVAGDLVLAIDRYGHSEYEQGDLDFTGEAGPRGNGMGTREAPFPSGRGDFDSSATRLLAYDVDTGQLRWSRGRSGDPGDPLAGGVFAGPPVELNDSLVVPYREWNDVYLLRLGKKDGRLLEKFYLCSQEVEGGLTVSAIHLIATNRHLFVPVGGGFVMALETAPLRRSWASAYPVARRLNALVGGVFASHWDGWFSGPPILAGSVLICTPSDSNDLCAFDSVTGRMVWRLPRRSHRVLLGSDGATVWLGGERISAIDVASGKLRWESDVEGVSGRGAVSGERILMPAGEELVLLDTQSGTELERLVLPDGGGALGNLLCSAGALFSVETYRVRKFPDLERTYAAALELLRREPNNARVNLRLAWLEAVKQNQQGVLDALNRIQRTEQSLDLSRWQQVHRLRVDAHLALAASSELDAAQVQQHLAAALIEAESVSDLVRARMASAELAARSGQLLESYRQYVSVLDAGDGAATNVVASRMMWSVSDLWFRRLSSVVRDRLEELAESLDSQDRVNLAQTLDEALSRAVESGDERRIHQFADLMILDGVGERALLVLSEDSRRARRYEQAEGYFLRAIRDGRDASGIARALAGLSEMYLEPGQNLVVEAKELLDRLGSEYANVSIGARGEGIRSDDPMPAGRVARILEAQIDGDLLDQRLASQELDTLDVVDSEAWRLPVAGDVRLVGFGSERPEALIGSAMVMIGSDQLQRLDLRTGELIWPLRLETLNRLSPPQETLDLWEMGIGMRSRGVTRAVTARAWSDGQTLLITSDEGIHAVGMVTGRTLWHKPRIRGDRSLRPASGIKTSESQGHFACIAEPGRLQMLRSSDGEVLWERRTESDDFWGVSVQGSNVFAIDSLGRRVHAFDARNGNEIGSFEFSHPESEYQIRVAVADTAIVGPSGKSIVAYDLATGKESWRIDPGETVSGLFKPGDDLIGVGLADGTCLLIEASTGRRVLDVRLGDFDRGVLDGSLDGGILSVRGGRTLEGSSGRTTLAGVDVQSGRIVWSEEDLPSRINLSNTLSLPRMMTRFPHWIPLYEYADGFRRGGRQLAGTTPEVRLTFISKQTGKPVAPPIEFEADSTTAYVPDLQVESDRVLVLTGTYMHVFGRPVGFGVHARGSDSAGPWGRSMEALGALNP